MLGNILHTNIIIKRYACTGVRLATALNQTPVPFQAVLIVDSCFESIDGKGDNGGKDGGSTVNERDYDGLALKIVVVLVVAGKSYE